MADGTLDAVTLRWAESEINRARELWKERRDKMARGTDRSACDAVCEVLNGCAAMIGGEAERVENQDKKG